MTHDNNPDNLSPLLQQAIEWLIRLRTSELSEEERQNFANWLSFDISHADAFARAEALFDNMTEAVKLKINNPQSTQNNP